VPLCMCRICTGLLTFSLAATDDLSVVMPDLQDMRKEIDGLDELEREILTQLSVTSASTGVTASHSAPQLHENLESKSSLRERLSLIRMKRSVSRSQHRQHLQHLLRGKGQNSRKSIESRFQRWNAFEYFPFECGPWVSIRHAPVMPSPKTVSCCNAEAFFLHSDRL
jgi:hypothetical protein